jgi:biopolymer transport protein ExbD
MGGGGGGAVESKGGRKPLDAILNLVPFIDLLSCCLAFLLMTAVWSTVARMNVAQKGMGQAGMEDKPPDTPTVNLTLFIDKDGFTFAKSTGESTPIPMKGEEYDFVKLSEILKEAKTAYPDKNDITIKSDDTVLYDKVVQTMDLVLSAKFPEIALADKGAGG